MIVGMYCFRILFCCRQRIKNKKRIQNWCIPSIVWPFLSCLGFNGSVVKINFVYYSHEWMWHVLSSNALKRIFWHKLHIWCFWHKFHIWIGSFSHVHVPSFYPFVQRCNQTFHFSSWIAATCFFMALFWLHL